MQAPKITPEYIESLIAYEYFVSGSKAVDRSTVVLGPALHQYEPPWIDRLSTLTICILVLRNGFTVVGTSSCASPENYKESIGHKLAREKAIEQLWPILGYQLRDKLHHEKTEHTHGPTRTKEGY
jgi:hypothetical protein